jgi:hypothetical protein
MQRTHSVQALCIVPLLDAYFIDSSYPVHHSPELLLS